MKSNFIARRSFLKGIGTFGTLTALESILPAYVWANAPEAGGQPSELRGDVINLTIAETPFRVGDMSSQVTSALGSLAYRTI